MRDRLSAASCPWTDRSGGAGAGGGVACREPVDLPAAPGRRGRDAAPDACSLLPSVRLPGEGDAPAYRRCHPRTQCAGSPLGAGEGWGHKVSCRASTAPPIRGRSPMRPLQHHRLSNQHSGYSEPSSLPLRGTRPYLSPTLPHMLFLRWGKRGPQLLNSSTSRFLETRRGASGRTVTFIQTTHLRPLRKTSFHKTVGKSLRLRKQEGDSAHLQSRKTWKCKMHFKLPNLFSEQNDISSSE